MKFGFTKSAVLSAMLLLGCGIMGCGPGGPATVPVSGTITKAGQPLPNVSITLIDNSKPDQTASGMSDSAGKFELTYGTIGKKGAVAGKYKVVLSGGSAPPTVPTGEAVGTYGGGGKPGVGGGSPMPVVDTPYDKAWASPETSPLEIEVKSGMAPLDIKVE